MKIVVGLGNPGRKYERTRHNAGFMAIDVLAAKLQVPIRQEKYHALIGRGRLDSRGVMLAKPQTYMNESGRAVGAMVRDVYAAASDLIVIHDELDLPFGVVRVKIGGGHGGHNGLRSILEHAGSPEFVRVRIGIGRPAPGRDSADFVLSPFTPEEKQAVAGIMERASEAVSAIVRDGVESAMNIFNQR